MNKRFLKLIVLFFILSTRSVFSIADWTILIYVQARNNLNRFAAQNLHSMSQVGSNRNLNILVEWYQPGQEGIWRYKILPNKIELDTYIPVNSDGTNTKDLVDSMRWATTKYPARNNSLILWNHGVGILDPAWKRAVGFGKGSIEANFAEESFVEENYALSEIAEEENKFQIKIDGILTDDFSFTQEFDPSNLRHRGILFNEQTRTYLTNQELVEALRQIKTNVLKNKKLDILGMDACLMAMVEVGYQAKGYAKYLVGSQEVELAYGWDYFALFRSISSGTTTPLEMAKGIVLTYEQFYKNRIRFYTQSAIDLDNMDYVRDNINNIVIKVNECKKYNNNAIKQLIKQARNSSLQFSTRSYIDLYSFYSEFFKKLNSFVVTKGSVGFGNKIQQAQTSKETFNIKNGSMAKSIKELKDSLQEGMRLLEVTVVAKTAGPNVPTAKGLSIYFPKGRIDDSYYKTNFAKDTLWLDLIQNAFA